MGDLLKNVFGGSKSKSTSVPVDMTPAQFRALRGPLSGALQELFGGSAEDLFNVPQSEAARSGEMAAPMTPAEREILQQLQREGGSRQALLEQTLAGRFLPGQEGGNPFLEAAIEAAQRPTLQGLEETLSRTLPGRFTLAGHLVQPKGSSAFDRAAAIATRGVAQELGDIATRMSFGAFESERQRQQEAIKFSQEEVDKTIAKLQAQALPRLIEDLGLERGLREFDTRMQSMIQLMGLMAGVADPTLGTVSRTESETMKGIIPALFPRGIGGGSTGEVKA